MKSKLWALVAALILMGISSGAGALSVSVQPAEQIVSLGSTLSVELWWDFAGDSTFGGGTDISWDSSILELVGIEFDANPAFDPAFTRSGDASEGLINGLATGAFEGLAGGGPMLIATITFEAIATGTSAVGVGPNDFPAGPFVSANTFGVQSVDFLGGSVTVVPLPAAVWLMIGGVGALLGFRRKA